MIAQWVKERLVRNRAGQAPFPRHGASAPISAAALSTAGGRTGRFPQYLTFFLELRLVDLTTGEALRQNLHC